MSLALKVPFVRALPGRYSSITDFTLPSEAKANVEVPFTVTGHLDSAPSPAWPNFTVGIYYMDGPMSEITLTVNGQTFTVTKGGGIIKPWGPMPPTCTSISLNCKIARLDEGTYNFAAMTGYVEGNYLYYDDRVDRTVEVKPEEVWPYWWWIAAAGGAVGLIVVIGAVAYEEKRKEEQLMMLMMARRSS
jgi:hypothetical protein